ncbi:MAG: FAD-dependent oxidoreductase [Cyanobacteria bacterium P01_H01_bin.130]
MVSTDIFPAASSPNAIAQDATVYIIGGGIAGLLVAQTLVAASNEAKGAVPWARIAIVERGERPGMGLTQGNGRSLTATEGLVAAGMTPAALDRALVTPLDQGGYAYPGFVPTAEDQTAMGNYAAGLRAIAADIDNRDLSLVRFGLANLTQWQAWASQYPDLAAASGFYLNEKLRIYGGAQAQTRAIAEVDRLNQAGPDCGWEKPGRLASYRDALAFDPAMEAYLAPRSNAAQQFEGALTLQPGGAIHVGRLVEKLTATLLASGQVALHTQARVRGIQWRSPGAGMERIIGGLLLEGNTPQKLGTANDWYVFATGFDGLLHQSGAIAAPLFPVAGTSITLQLPESESRATNGANGANAASTGFPQHAWKQDTLGPLVFSPTFDTVINRWILRVGGFKFYPGTGDAHPALDLNHPGARWAIHHQIHQAIAFLPDVVPQLLNGIIPSDRDPNGDWITGNGAKLEALQDILNPWIGLRPLYADGMAALGPFATNGYAISGTGSWGLSSGIGNAALIGQWLQGRSLDQLNLAGIPTRWLRDYLERVDPLRF